MKKKRKIWLTAGCIFLAVLVLIYVLLLNREEETADATDTVEEESENILSLTQEDVVSISYTLDGETIAWNKQEEHWILSSDENFPTDDSEIENIVSTFTLLTSERTLEDVENLKDYGLETPVNQMTLADAEGNEEIVSIGTINPSTQCTYIYINDDSATVYTVTSDLGSLLDADLFDYAVSEEYPTITSSYIYEMNIVKNKNSFSIYSDVDSSTGWYVKDAKGKVQEADTNEVSSIQSTLGGLDFSGYYEYDCQDWSAYGLDNPQMTIEVKYTEEVEVEETDESEKTEESEESSEDAEVTYETVEKSVTLYVGNLSEDGMYYVRMDDSSEVRGIAQATLSTYINGKAFEYWSLAVASVGISDLDYLEVVYDGKTYELKRVVEEVVTAVENEDGETTQETETTTTYFVNDVEVDSTTFMEFYRSAAGVECQKRLEETQKVKNPELVLRYYGTDGDFVQISYGERDSSFYNVTDQDGNSGMVNKMTVKELINQLIDLVDEMEK